MPACSHSHTHTSTHTETTCAHTHKLQKDRRHQSREHGTVVCVFTPPLPIRQQGGSDFFSSFFFSFSFIFGWVNWCCLYTELNECCLTQILLAQPMVSVWVKGLAVIFYLCAFSAARHMISGAALTSLYHANVFQFPPTKSVHNSYKRWLQTGRELSVSVQHSHTLAQSLISAGR